MVRIARLTLLAALLALVTSCQPTAGTASEPPESEKSTILRAQIFLDEAGFGPGILDGKVGDFTRKALAHWNLAQGHFDQPGNWFYVLRESQKAVPQLTTTYTIQPSDQRFLTPGLPYAPEDQAKSKYMGYRNMLELVAERYHSKTSLLRGLNPDKKMWSLSVGDTVNVPNVTPFEIASIPKNYQFPKDPVLSNRKAIVDTSERWMTIYETDGSLLAAFPITPGRPEVIRRGDWKVVIQITTPTFRYDKQMLAEGTRSDEYYKLPPGPNSPVGIIWTGTNRSGIGLHGTSEPDIIGRSRSSGCVRLANWDAWRLRTYLRPGAQVTIR
ncbi:MAG: L,D-transpeptidase [Verrucomicrobiota bacterium]